MRKLTLLVVFGLGYVLGTRAGRERFEQLRSTFDKVRQDPRVQEKTQQAVDVAKQRAPLVADKVTSAAGTAAGAAKDKVTGGTASSEEPQPHFMAGPHGDLP